MNAQQKGGSDTSPQQPAAFKPILSFFVVQYGVRDAVMAWQQQQQHAWQKPVSLSLTFSLSL